MDVDSRRHRYGDSLLLSVFMGAGLFLVVILLIFAVYFLAILIQECHELLMAVHRMYSRNVNRANRR